MTRGSSGPSSPGRVQVGQQAASAGDGRPAIRSCSNDVVRKSPASIHSSSSSANVLGRPSGCMHPPTICRTSRDNSCKRRRCEADNPISQTSMSQPNYRAPSPGHADSPQLPPKMPCQLQTARSTHGSLVRFIRLDTLSTSWDTPAPRMKGPVPMSVQMLATRRIRNT
jgi:hypothetical protein